MLLPNKFGKFHSYPNSLTWFESIFREVWTHGKIAPFCPFRGLHLAVTSSLWRWVPAAEVASYSYQVLRSYWSNSGPNKTSLLNQPKKNWRGQYTPFPPPPPWKAQSKKSPGGICFACCLIAELCLFYVMVSRKKTLFLAKFHIATDKFQQKSPIISIDPNQWVIFCFLPWRYGACTDWCSAIGSFDVAGCKGACTWITCIQWRQRTKFTAPGYV